MYKSYEEAYLAHLEYLKEYVRSPKGVTQGYLVYDQFGEVVHRVGRISNNAHWYQEFYKKHKRKPNLKDLEKIAKDHIQNGFYDEYGYIPPLFPK